MKRHLTFWLVFVIAATLIPWSAWKAGESVAWAAGVVRYVDSAAGACTGNYSIASRNCTGSDGNSYATIAAGLSATGAGDILYVRAGTFSVQVTSTIPSGVSSSIKTTFATYNSETVTLNPTNAATQTRVIYISGQDNIVIRGFVLDGAGVTGDGIKVDSFSENIEIIGNEIKNAPGQCIYIGRVGGNIIRNNNLHNCGVDGFEHGIYYNAPTNGVVEGNLIHDNAGSAIQMYPEANGTQFRRNKVYNNCRGATVTTGSQVIISYQNNVVEYNEIYETAGNCTNGILVNNASPLNAVIRHNSVYCTGSCTSTTGAGVKINQGTGAKVQNNIILGYSNATLNSGTGTTFTSNLISAIASDVWTDPVNGDFTLKSTSAAINAGTNIGFSFCGSAPDQGAYERPVVTAASIFGNLLDVTVCNIAPPIQPLGTWTPACTGTGCGAPVTSTVSLLGGSGGIVRVTVGGITGGNCAAGQTWTISATGANTDSALTGNSTSQPFTTTSFPVNSSTCNGTGGGGAPGGNIALYELEGNTNDTSGSGNHAIGSSGITYVSAQAGQGAQMTAGADSYIDTGLLSGHNPSTTHLVVAFGVRIDAADLGMRRIVAGTSVGTDQRFYIRRNDTNIWNLSVSTISSPVATEFPVVAGDTHVCVKFNPTSDTATLYINGVAGTTAGASVISYASYTFASTFRIGLPSGFPTVQSGNDTFDSVSLYTSDVSCSDLYTAWQPATGPVPATQATHQWQGVFTLNDVAENRGAVDTQRTIVKGGAGALMVQLNNTSGASVVFQPRFRYNVNGGAFSNVVPDSPTADGVSYWGASVPTGLNNGLADGPISGALGHTDGITLTTSSAIPTLEMANNTSYTLRGVFRVDAALDDVVCFKVYDQGGSELASYTPAGGACLTVIASQANGGF